MAAKTFHCRLITPLAKVLDEPVKYASVPAWDGLFGVLPDHAPLVAKLGTGELKLEFPDRDGARGGSRSYLVEDGFVQMVNNRLTILAAKAIPVEAINMAEAEAELQRLSGPEAGPRTAMHARRDKDREFARAKVRLARQASGRI